MDIVNLPVSEIVPNGHNPNDMTDEQFSQLVEQTRHLGHVFKPVVVRRVAEHYEIIDGEHAWRAAKETGLTAVDCELVEADDLEARRQMLVRNLHGKHDPVREARVYQEMKTLGGLSNRQLAPKVGKSEASIRNALKYLEVVELYEPDWDVAETTVSRLSISQVDCFLQIPPPLRSVWLHAGGETDIWKQILKSSDSAAFERLNQVVSAGLDDLIPGDEDFARRMRSALSLCKWAAKNLAWLDEPGPYLRPVMELDLKTGILEQLPRQVSGKTITILLSAATWADLLKRYVRRKQDNDWLGREIRRVLQAQDIDPAVIATARELDLWEMVRQAPAFISEADWLSLEEQFAVAQFVEWHNGSAADETVQQVLDFFRCARQDDAPTTSCGVTLPNIRQELAETYKRLAEIPGLTSQKEYLVGSILENLAKEGLDEIQLFGRSARDAMHDQLSGLQQQFLYFIHDLTDPDLTVRQALLRWSGVLSPEEVSA